MKTPVVRLKIRVRLSDGSCPFLDPVLSNKGKLKPLHALVHGKPEHRPEGVYFLRYLKDGKRIWESVGTDPIFALDEKRRREKGLDAHAAGVTLAEQPERSTRVNAAIAEYLEEVHDAKATKTFLAYSLTLRLFAEVVSRETLEQIDRKDVLAFIRSMREGKQTPRTIANRVSYLNIFFHRSGLKSPLLKTDKIKFTEKVVTAYSSETLKVLFATASQEEYELFQFFLCTEAREVTGDSMSFPVVIGDRGCFCVPTMMLGHYGPDTHFWIGFARLSSKAKITKVFPLPCFDELKSRVAEIMMAARVVETRTHQKALGISPRALFWATPRGL